VRVQVLYAKGDRADLPDGVEIHYFPPGKLGQVWSWGVGLRSCTRRLATQLDGMHSVFHLHGVWSAPQYFAAMSACDHGVPFIVSPHGMLEPWLWDDQGWKIRIKKRLYWAVTGYPALSKASVIHAITPLEQKHLSGIFPRKRIEIIPNAIDIPEFGRGLADERGKRILYLGRIEPKKGADILLRAFAAARISRDWTLDIAGPVWSEGYWRQLQEIVRQFDLDHRVRFLGPVFGEEKQKLIDRAWIMAVPSHSEVVGLVNLEAAVNSLPTITTHQTGLYDWESGGGILINPRDDELRRALEDVCSWSVTERRDRGLAGRRLVARRYSWQAVLPIWLSLYESLRESI
jgi:glycosyltransferase involved in cell wall biosynthesis